MQGMAKPNVRDKILRAGLDRFHRVGFNGSSVEDITDLAGVPKGSFYNHFKSKEDLALQVIGRYIEQSPHALLGDTAIPPLKRLKSYFSALGQQFVDSGYKKGCLLGNFSSELADHSGPVRRRLEIAFDDWVKQIAAVIKEAQKVGEVDSKLKPEQLAGVLLSAFEGALLRGRVSGDSAPLKEFTAVGFGRLIG
jgi:TetR/AcrR family transcriptional regulator, transcriptional repressor for nem operon